MDNLLDNQKTGERAFEIQSRLLRERIIFLGQEIDDDVAHSIAAQLLFLESEDPEKHIYLYINSPGGSITAGMAIYNTMQQIKPDVVTICIGWAAGMGAVLLSGGAKGKRMALRNSRMKLSRLTGGAAIDLKVQRQDVYHAQQLYELLAQNTGQSAERLYRDFFLSAQEAKDNGFIDQVIDRLCEVSTTGWSRQALLLLDGLSWVLNHPPRRKWDVAATWEAVIAQKPELAELDARLIHAFLEPKLFRSTEEPMAPKTPVPPLEPPPLTHIVTKRKRSTEPLIPWLFSRQDIQIKAQVAVASVLMLTAGWLTFHDASVRSARDAAYQQILAAEQRQDYLKVLKGAEAFFANTPLSGKDGRNQQVMQLYSKALVRWVAQQEGQLDGEAQKHLDRYRAVMSNSTQEEGN